MAVVKPFEIDVRTPGKGVHIEVSDPENEVVAYNHEKATWQVRGYLPTSLIVVHLERGTQYIWVMRKPRDPPT